jgi:hypothetical protein
MRNVVLVCLDTVREDTFREHATRLRGRADVVLEGCRAASSWSAPSHASMFTGRLAHEHGVHAYHRDFSGLTRDDTFLGDLPEHRALGTSANVWAGASFGFDGLFDDFSEVSPDQRFPQGIDVARFGQECEAEGLAKQAAFLRAAVAHDHPVKSLANGALVQLDDWFARAPVPKPMDDGASILIREALSQVAASTEPFALFVNFMDAHGPMRHVRGYDRSLHDAPNAWSSESTNWTETAARGDDALLERYRGLYAAAVDYLDRRVCEFADRLHEATELETTVVVTSDHGDNLARPGEGTLWGHTESALTEGLLHVPGVVLNAPALARDEPDGDGGGGADGDGSGKSDDEGDGRAPVTVTEPFSHLALGDLLVGYATGERRERALSGTPVLAERAGHSGKQHRMDERPPETNRVLRAVYESAERKVVYSPDDGTAYRLDPARPCWQAEAGAVDGPDRAALDEAHFGEPIAAFRRRARSDAGEVSMTDDTRDRLDHLGYL